MLIKRYSLEFILNNKEINQEELKKSLADFGENLNLADNSMNGQQALKVSVETFDPATIFDISAQFGRIGAIRVNEITT